MRLAKVNALAGLCGATLLSLSLAIHSAFAAEILVHNTGVDATNTLVASGAQADFWTLLSKPAGATETVGSETFRFRHPSYAADTSTSAWVSMAASGNATASGIYVYELLIDLTGLDPDTVVITGQFGTDNDGFIRVNGGDNEATATFAGFGTLVNFTLDEDFVSGINSIQVGVNNGGNPTAFHVLFTGAGADPIDGQVPEPATLALLGIALAGLGFSRRKQVN